MTGTTTARRPRLAARTARLRSSDIREILRVVEDPRILSLAGGLPAPASLPVGRIGVALERALTRTGPNGATALQYGPTEGLTELRELVAPGTPGSPALGEAAQVLVTTGSQQGIDLVVRALVDEGAPVVVEDPLFLGTRQVLEAAGARLVPVPVDEHGLDPDRVAALLADGLRPALLVCVPNWSNPTGASLPAERRVALARLAERYGFTIVEDDPYHGLGFHPPPTDDSISRRFSGPQPPESATKRVVPPAAVRVHAPDHVVTLASASKMLAPGLRLGFVGAPAWLAPTLALIKQSVDLHSPTLNQLVACDLLADHAFLPAHLAAVRRANAERAIALRDALAGVVDAPVPTGGMFIWGRTAVDTRATFAAAVEAGVAYVPGDAFTVARDGTHALRLGFATLEPDDLRVAAGRLRSAFATAAARPGVAPLP